MKIRNHFYSLVLVALFPVFILSCKKEWLDIKPDKGLVVPTTIADYQALLDNFILFAGADCILDEVGAGDFYIKDANLSSLSQKYLQNLYVWAPDIFEDNLGIIADWASPYERIFNANIVLEGISKIVPKNNIEEIAWNNVKGASLFYRAFNHYSIAKCFCKVYDKATAESDLGIPIRLESDINIPSVRSTVEQSYTQIINDLKSALSILPISSPPNNTYRLRPTKAAAAAMLARVYLSMSFYDSAYLYSDKTLALYNTLMDYNSNPPVNIGITNSFSRLNGEVLFDMPINNYTIFSPLRLIVDSLLYKSYDINDRRREAFFRTLSGNITLKGSYFGNSILFSGLATNEIYLIRSECNARLGNKDAAITDLNALMIKRWKNNGTWVPFDASDANDALKKILVERRKELCFRGLRWSDLRRLNREPQFAVILNRIVNGETYVLPPNDPKYILPIPPGVILLTNMPQNPR